jgi:phosphonate transport system substrate-binding protein
MRATLRRIAVVLICVASAFTCEIALAEPLYRFGVPPWQRGQSADDTRRLYEPLLDYLGRATGAKITIVTARSYEDMVHYFADGRVDFGTISPVPYVLAQRLNPGVKLLLTELSWDPTHTKRIDSYQGMIVTLRARDDINTVDDLRGKRIGFVTEESTSGFVFPSAYLQSIGIDYKNDFRSYAFLGR